MEYKAIKLASFTSVGLSPQTLSPKFPPFFPSEPIPPLEAEDKTAGKGGQMRNKNENYELHKSCCEF